MKSIFARLAAALAAGIVIAVTPAWADSADDDSGSMRAGKLHVVALTADQRLLLLRADKPEKARVLPALAGLQASDSALIGIDYRVQDGQLYGVGNGGGVYVIDPASGVATKTGQLTVALAGSQFGVDFNPAANALRIVSDTGQNLRHPFAGSTAGQTQSDNALNYAGVVAMGITGSAYVNNDLDPSTGTTLFALDTNLDQVALQSPPNAGTLVATGKLTVDSGSQVGFDIHSSQRNGVTTANQALASLSVDGEAGLYEIDLLTGKARLLGKFSVPVIDIAIPLDQG